MILSLGSSVLYWIHDVCLSSEKLRWRSIGDNWQFVKDFQDNIKIRGQENLTVERKQILENIQKELEKNSLSGYKIVTAEQKETGTNQKTKNLPPTIINQ